jgi:hypothetical protein
MISEIIHSISVKATLSKLLMNFNSKQIFNLDPKVNLTLTRVGSRVKLCQTNFLCSNIIWSILRNTFHPNSGVNVAIILNCCRILLSGRELEIYKIIWKWRNLGLKFWILVWGWSQNTIHASSSCVQIIWKALVFTL